MESDNTSTAPPTGGQDTVFDEACRILTISASVDAGKDFVELVKARSSSSSSPTPSSSSSPSTSIPHIVPYTLSNRYYTADLHFALWPLDGLVVPSSPHFLLPNHDEETKLPPAVIFVWVDGEPYAKHVERLSQTLQSGGYEPEVCLAVRIPKADMSSTTSATQAGTSPENKDANLQEDDDDDEDNANIDSTLMSFGFEYVDATQERTRPRSERRDADDDDIDIPGLPRVFDALSTIMWPSMRTPAKNPSSKAKGNTNGQRISTRSPHSVAQQQERIAIMEELLSVSEISGLGGWSGSVMIGQEIEVVDGESDEEEVGTPVDFSYGFERKRSGVPWLSGTRKSTLDQTQTQTSLSFEGEGELSASPTDIHGLSPFGEMGPGSGSGKKISIGFEDDFTVFVSAPPPGASPNTSMEGIVEEDGETLKDGLGHELHLRADASLNPYRSLGSVSDFGGSDFGDGEDEKGYQELDELDEDQEGWEDTDEKEWDEEGDNESWDVDGEEGLPSKEEIRQTAARIFGGVSGPSPGPGGGEKEKEKAKGIFAKASDVLKEQQDQESSPSTKKGKDTSSEMKERMRRLGGMAAAADIRGAFGSEGQEEEDEEGGAFDLERVLHSLQAMRSEIADIEDEDEKRKMAARVALGLVYGLDGMDAG